jgi:hypothetical protein
LEEKSDAFIFNQFADCLISSVRKLRDIKVEDVKIEELIDAIEELKIDGEQASL